MWQKQWLHASVLVKRLAIVVGLFFLCRIIFFIFNADLFPFLSFNEYVAAIVIGLKYDVGAVLIINTFFILFHLIPHNWRGRKRFQGFLKLQYYTINGGFLMLEAADFIYFRYASERTSTHILGLRHDIVNLIPQFLIDFWYVLLAVLFLFFVVEWFYKRTSIHIRHSKPTPVLIVGAFIVVIFGFPPFLLQGERTSDDISVYDATELVGANEVPLTTNTTFTVIKSIITRQLKVKNYMPEEEAKEEFNIHKSQHNASPMAGLVRGTKKPNVMVIMLESFSTEYIGYFNEGKGYTPFLDSLFHHAIVYDNAFANGKHSIDAVTSITLGVPPLMVDPFISSPYFENDFLAMGHYMKELGYNNYFFHGSMDHSMQMNKFLPRAGFDQFIGMEDYGNMEDFDESWGIYDEPFFQFTAKELDKVEKPFNSVLFSLTSHHPFTIPKDFDGEVRNGPLPIHKTVSYTDEALRRFFQTASQMDWFYNTVFIITADHTGPLFQNNYKTPVGIYDIPMAIYKPGLNVSFRSEKVVQQTDILPTILDICGFEGKFTAFGNSMLSKNEGFAVNTMNGVYQIIGQEYLLQFNGKETVGLFNYKTDKLLQQDISSAYPEKKSELETRLKAIIQQFNEAMIKDKLMP